MADAAAKRVSPVVVEEGRVVEQAAGGQSLKVTLWGSDRQIKDTSPNGHPRISDRGDQSLR